MLVVIKSKIILCKKNACFIDNGYKKCLIFKDFGLIFKAIGKTVYCNFAFVQASKYGFIFINTFLFEFSILKLTISIMGKNKN